MGGGGSKAPEPSEEERALQREQANILRMQQQQLTRQQKQYDILAPILYKELGYAPQYDSEGNLLGLNPIASEEDALRKEINLKYLQREKAALAGELPVNPGLLSDLAERDQELEQQFVKDYGSVSDARRSSGGQQMLAKWNAQKASVLDAARRGDIQMASQLGLQRDQANLSRSMMPQGVPGMQANYNNLAAMYGQALQPYQQQRALDTQMMMASANNRAGTLGSLIGGAAGMGAAYLMFSSHDFKEAKEPIDYDQILEAFDTMSVETWRYIGHDRTHIGPYAEDFRAAFGVGDGKTISMIDAVGVLIAAVKALKSRVRELEYDNG